MSSPGSKDCNVVATGRRMKGVWSVNGVEKRAPKSQMLVVFVCSSKKRNESNATSSIVLNRGHQYLGFWERKLKS